MQLKEKRDFVKIIQKRLGVKVLVKESNYIGISFYKVIK